MSSSVRRWPRSSRMRIGCSAPAAASVWTLAAVAAWLYGVGLDSGWPQSLLLRLSSLLAGCAEQARQCPRAAASHVLLGGLFAQFDGLQTELAAAFAAGPAGWAALWQRDHNLLNIAAGARAKRLEKALQALHLAY